MNKMAPSDTGFSLWIWYAIHSSSLWSVGISQSAAVSPTVQRSSLGWASPSSPSWFSAHIPTASLNPDLFESIWMGEKKLHWFHKGRKLSSQECVLRLCNHSAFSLLRIPGDLSSQRSTFSHHLCLGSALRSADFPSASDATRPTPTQSLFFNLRMLKYFAILKHSES